MADINGIVTIGTSETPGEATVLLFNEAGDTIVASTTSDPGTGAYSFTGLATGTYRVAVMGAGVRRSRLYGPCFTEDVDPDFGNVASLLHMNGADTSTVFIDVTGKVWTVSGAAQIDTAQSVFGGASFFNPSAGRIQTPSHADFDFGTDAFTIEWRERRADHSGFQNSFSRGYALAGGMFFQSGGGAGRTMYFINSGGTPESVLSTGAFGFVINTWYAMAVQRDATGVVRLFIDGTQIDTLGPNADTTMSLGLDAPFVIGADNASSYWHNGWLDEFRITKGVARYTDAGYTPATAPFPDV